MRKHTRLYMMCNIKRIKPREYILISVARGEDVRRRAQGEEPGNEAAEACYNDMIRGSARSPRA